MVPAGISNVGTGVGTLTKEPSTVSWFVVVTESVCRNCGLLVGEGVGE